MTPDYTPSLLRSFERHLRAENRSDNTIESYLESIRQAEAFLAAGQRRLVCHGSNVLSPEEVLDSRSAAP